MQITRYSCQILLEVEYSRWIFEKYSNINFDEMNPVGDKVFQEDGRIDMATLTIASCDFANGPKKLEFEICFEQI